MRFGILLLLTRKRRKEVEYKEKKLPPRPLQRL
jgi:hypothetical protein